MTNIKNHLINPKKSHWKLAEHFIVSTLLVIPLFIVSEHSKTASFFLSCLLLPILFFRSFALMHDASHGAVSNNKWVNNAIGIISGTLCLLPFNPWRKLHSEHHQWAGNIDQDPVMKIVKEYPSYSKSKKSIISFCWKWWIPLPALMQNILFWIEGLKRVKVKKFKNDLFWDLASLVFPLVVYGSLIHFLGTYWGIVFLSSYTIYLTAVEVINFPHHLGLAAVEGHSKLPFRQQFQIARSCHYPKWISHWILNNFNYHIEHHMYPNLPWYRLGELRSQIKLSLGNQYNESSNIHWILENRPINF